MTKKDLRETLDSIEQSQDVTARMEEKVKRLTELVERQKKIISEQTALLDKQKSKISEMDDVPDDIIELKRIIGEQRAHLRERDLELEHAKGSMVQAQKELEVTIKRMNPTQVKLEAALQTIGELKAELAEKSTEITVKNETLKTLSNRIKEAESKADAFREQMDDFKGDGISKNVVDDLKIKHSEEKQKLKQEISKLESQLLDHKLASEEKIAEAKDKTERYDDLVNKLNDLNEKNQEAKEKIKSLEAGMANLKKFKEENYSKLFFLEKLQPLMEEAPLFKSFFIVQAVGSISLEDLRNAVGAPIVTVKRDVERLEKIGVLEIGDDEKIAAKKFE